MMNYLLIFLIWSEKESQFSFFLSPPFFFQSFFLTIILLTNFIEKNWLQIFLSHKILFILRLQFDKNLTCN